MKILHIITSLRVGGAEKLLAEISPLMQVRGHQVDVFVFDGIDTFFKQSLEKAGIHVISYHKNLSVYHPIHIFYIWRLKKQYDIIHTHLTSPQFFAAFACGHRLPLVTTEHNTINRRRNIFFRAFDRWMYNQYRYVISISQKTEKNLSDYLGKSRCRFITIHNGINIIKYQNALPLNRDVKGTDKKVITMIAAFRKQKDQITLINTLEYLAKSEYEIWLVGDGEERHKIEKHIEKTGTANNVRLWGNRSDIPSILKSTDIVVLSSKWEGFGLSIVEGMAAGKPVVGTNVDGLSQIVDGAGLLFEVGDAQQLAAHINQLANDADYYSEVARKCKLRAKDFDINVMVDKYLNVYEKCLYN